MAFCSTVCHSQISNQINSRGLVTRASFSQRSCFAVKATSTRHVGKQAPTITSRISNDWSFIGGSRIIIKPKLQRSQFFIKSPGVRASWLATSQVASSVFTLGTAAVLPFYTLMVLAPNAELTRKSMQTTAPYVVLGVLYAYLLYLSWTPDTIKLMFASKYLLPELPGIAKMFSSEMTLASAWIHLLAVDLFAARQVFHDGLENGIETRHSISLCLLFCPVGIIAHVITKALTKNSRNAQT